MSRRGRMFVRSRKGLPGRFEARRHVDTNVDAARLEARATMTAGWFLTRDEVVKGGVFLVALTCR
jgi:hypothetical protein